MRRAWYSISDGIYNRKDTLIADFLTKYEDQYEEEDDLLTRLSALVCCCKKNDLVKKHILEKKTYLVKKAIWEKLILDNYWPIIGQQLLLIVIEIVIVTVIVLVLVRVRVIRAHRRIAASSMPKMVMSVRPIGSLRAAPQREC